MAPDVNIIGLAPAMREILRNETPGLKFGGQAALRRLIEEGFVHVVQPKPPHLSEVRAWLRENVERGDWRVSEFWPFCGFRRHEDAIAFRMRWA